ncbi:AT RICH INTERACTION DOMAIN 2 [Hibiscus trionum]|uniref:AT RICH INTERACTION DOMAIN 2 n=1 Tax=Hibiscus trionum TaxID=183268 RepID=A0A9W7LRT9_HIBTR|nr:AT RICH INTERACTION DOMAIN 2 [Hibiscus trionum]
MMSEQMEMTGFGSEAHMFDSKRVLAEFEAVFEAESVGLAPMVTETEAAEVKDDADGVGNEQKTTGELGNENSDNLWPDTEEGRGAFVKDVEAFYKGNNLVFRRPKFYKEELNLLKLWNAVIDLGGYEKVTSCKLWKHVGELFNPPKTCTTASRIFRHYYEKALLAYEKHKKPDLQPPPSVPSLVEPIWVVSPVILSKYKHSNSSLLNGEVCHLIIKDKSSSPAPKSDNQPKTSGSLKRKKPSATDHGAETRPSFGRFGTMLFDIGAPADNVTVKVKKTDNSYEVYALIPGFRPHEVIVESDPAGLFVVISGEPKVLDDPWGVASFKKVVCFPSKIDPSKTSAVITERLQVYVCAPFEISDESK